MYSPSPMPTMSMALDPWSICSGTAEAFGPPTAITASGSTRRTRAAASSVSSLFSRKRLVIATMSGFASRRSASSFAQLAPKWTMFSFSTSRRLNQLIQSFRLNHFLPARCRGLRSKGVTPPSSNWRIQRLTIPPREACGFCGTKSSDSTKQS